MTAVDADAARLRELGYNQEVRRGLGLGDSVAVGFAAISPVVGLYAVFLVAMTVAGPAWVWVLPVALAGQCLLLALYAELASEFPIANGPYQWTRRIVGPRYGWFTGWVAVCAYAVANTTIAYLGAPWVLVLLDVAPTPQRLVITAAGIVLVCSLANVWGIGTLKRAVRAGVVAEAVASVGIGIVLLLAFRHQSASVLTDTLGAPRGSTAAALFAALAVGGWAFIGFDACVATGEETEGAARHLPRAVWVALLAVGALVILNGVAMTLASPSPEAVIVGEDLDPVTTSVVSSFGSWSSKPFAAVTLIAFVACGVAAQGASARVLWSMARDGVVPGSRWLRQVDSRAVPLRALVVITVVAWAGLLLALDKSAIGTLISFGTAAFYVAFLLIAAGALAARTRGWWRPAGEVRLGRLGLVLNVLAVGWLAVETVNIAWPRTILAPPDAPWYQVWAAPLLLAVIGAVGCAYLLATRPQDRIP